MPTIQQSRQRALDERLQAHQIGENEYRVYNTVKHTSYSVLKSASGIWSCTCPFMTKGSHVGTQGVCKHITRVLDKLRGCGQNYCRAGKLCASCRFEEKMLSE
jgi:uncharacterized Zn finger protein